MFATPLRAARQARKPVLVTALLSATIAAGMTVPAGATTVQASSDVQVSSVLQTRDPLSWPFARNSIWNTPIGSAASYVPAGLQAANAATNKRVTADPEYISVNPKDPLRTLSVPGQAGDGAQVRVAPDLAHGGSWNGCSTLLTADGRSVWSGQPLKLTAGGTPTWTWTTQKAPVDLRGDGIEGCHGGSRMSGIGGSLRVGELNSTAALRHALKVNLYCKKYCYKGVSKSDSKRWPALTADAYWASGYSGTVPQLRMGALLALPPGTDLSSITHPKVRKLATAFRDYGGYLVDDTAWDVHAVDMDQRLVKSGEWPTGADTAFHAQLQLVFQALAVVDNNTPTSIGGGGVPRVPLAPCFADDAACLSAEQALIAPVVSPSPTAAPVVSTSPSPTTAPVVSSAPVDPYVSSLTPTSAVNGYGPYSRDLSNGGKLATDGRRLTLAGRPYARGLGVHAGSSLTYKLDKKFAHFTANIGVDDEVGSAGSVTFEVWADGVRRFTSARMTGSSATARLSLSMWNVSTLRLVVKDGGNGITSDHADWADARLWSR